jgi:ATP-grasp domain-containing protein
VTPSTELTDSPRTTVKPLLIVVGSGERTYREYILRSVSHRYRLWLMHPEEPSWERQYLEGHTVVDNTSPELLTAAAVALAEQRSVSGVFCYDEGLVWPAAHASDALGLPGNGPDVIRSCRDKHATRLALDAAGVPQPASTAVTSLDEAYAAGEAIGYPVVLKPRGLAGSKGVQRADDSSELEGAYDAARSACYPGVPTYEAGVLVEEYVEGPEISVDAVFFEGAFTPMVIARKRVGFAPFFEEVGHVVDGADPLFDDPELHDLLDRCHRALGYRFGVTHTEVILTPRGMRLLEVNARLGGDLIPHLGELASGVDPAMAAADAAAGRRPAPQRLFAKVAAVRFLYPAADIEADSIEVAKGDWPDSIREARAMVAPGAVLRLPPRGYLSRYGFAVAVGGSTEQVLADLQHAPRIVQLAGRALAVEDEVAVR